MCTALAQERFFCQGLFLLLFCEFFSQVKVLYTVCEIVFDTLTTSQLLEYVYAY